MISFRCKCFGAGQQVIEKNNCNEETIWVVVVGLGAFE
jgi:hypothetical protein